jgi:hypothetical protein
LTHHTHTHTHSPHGAHPHTCTCPCRLELTDLFHASVTLAGHPQVLRRCTEEQTSTSSACSWWWCVEIRSVRGQRKGQGVQIISPHSHPLGSHVTAPMCHARSCSCLNRHSQPSLHFGLLCHPLPPCPTFTFPPALHHPLHALVWPAFDPLRHPQPLGKHFLTTCVTQVAGSAVPKSKASASPAAKVSGGAVVAHMRDHCVVMCAVRCDCMCDVQLCVFCLSVSARERVIVCVICSCVSFVSVCQLCVLCLSVSAMCPLSQCVNCVSFVSVCQRVSVSMCAD